MRNIIALSTLALGVIIGGLSATPQTVLAQLNDPICRMSESGAVDCSYRSMSQCLQSRSGPTDTCGINSAYESGYDGTVGFGGAAPNAVEGRPLRSEPEPDATR